MKKISLKNEIIESLVNIILNILPRLRIIDFYRYKLYKLTGIKFSGKCEICGNFDIKTIGKNYNIKIGDGTFFNKNVFFEPYSSISIGNFCQIGPSVMFETVSHELIPKNNYREIITKSIIIDDYVWIGAGSIILPGVHIGEGSVIAAGSIVNKDIPSFTLYGGVPAKKIKNLINEKI